MYKISDIFKVKPNFKNVLRRQAMFRRSCMYLSDHLMKHYQPMFPRH
jgi:hypothetical protein